MSLPGLDADPDMAQLRGVLSEHWAEAMACTLSDVKKKMIEQEARFNEERLAMQATIEEQDGTIGDLSAEIAKFKIEKGGANKAMDMVRDKLAATFGFGQSATKTKHLHTRILLYWRAFAKASAEEKKLNHVANAIHGRSLKTKVMNAWVSYHTGSSRDKERAGSQVSDSPPLQCSP